jgi:hypothetical protein
LDLLVCIYISFILFSIISIYVPCLPIYYSNKNPPFERVAEVPTHKSGPVTHSGALIGLGISFCENTEAEPVYKTTVQHNI